MLTVMLYIIYTIYHNILYYLYYYILITVLHVHRTYLRPYSVIVLPGSVVTFMNHYGYSVQHVTS